MVVVGGGDGGGGPGHESTKEMYGGIFCALSLLYRPFAPE